MKKIRSKTLKAVFIFLSVCSSLSAQELVEDYQAIIKGRPFISSVVLAADGNLLAGGSIDYFGNDVAGSIIKMDLKGNLVAGFQKIIANGEVMHIAALNDGRFFASGKFSKINGQPTGKLVKFNADGSVDEAFAINFSEEIRDFAIQSTGKIIITGFFENLMGKGYTYVARLNADGTLDETFMKGNTRYVSALSINENDEIIVNHIDDLVKLTAEGALDATFNFSMEGRIQTDHIELLPDGKSFVSVSHFSSTDPPRFIFYRLNANGSVDATFPQLEMPHQIYTFEVLSSGNIVLSGVFSSYNNQPANAVLMKSDGSFDKILVVTETNFITDVLEDASQGLVFTGEFHYVNGFPHLFMARLNPDHTLDPEFNPEITRGLLTVSGSGIQFDGKLIVAGTYDLIGAADDVRSTLVRLNTNGTADASFNAEISNSSLILAMEVQPDNKILVGGLSITQDPHSGFTRLLPDGQLDDSFEIGPGPQTGTSASYIQEIRYKNGKIYLSGPFTQFNAQPYSRFVILDVNGNIVGPENKILPEGAIIQDIEVQDDGKIVLTGFFPLREGFTPRIIRLLENGSLDPAFPGVTTDGFIRDMDVDSHNRILVIGGFQNLGDPASNIARLNENGTVDPTFAIGTGVPIDVENSLLAVKVLPNDVVAVSGSFDIYNGQSSPAIVFLDTNGTKMPFPSSIHSVSSVPALAYRNNILYAIGRVVSDDGANVSSAMKILFDFPVGIEPSASEGPERSVMFFPNPFEDRINIQLSEAFATSTVKLYSQSGALLMEEEMGDGNFMTLKVDHLPPGLFLVRVQSGNRIRNLKLVKQ